MLFFANLTSPFVANEIPFPENAKSHHEVSAWRERVFLDSIRRGTHQPMVLNLFLTSSIALLVFFLLPSVRSFGARLSFFFLSTAIQLHVITVCRSANPTVGFLIGFLSGWNILWSAVLLIFNNAKKNFQKIEKINRTGKYQWQQLPAQLGGRLGWTLDLVYNSRGIGWSWKVSGTPSRPPPVEADLQNIELAAANERDKPTSTGRRRYTTKGEVVQHYATQVILGYVAMDVLKVFVNHDPYFWGILNASAPNYLPIVFHTSSILLRAYRGAVCLAFMWLALGTSFAMVPVAFTLLSSGTNGEPWMYPDQFGPYSTVFSRGLAGFWGGWWHQLFRYGFQTTGRWLTRDVLKVSKNAQLVAVVELLVSFYISGFMHVAASYTMIGMTRPWWNMFFFFAIQPAGIILELVASHFLYLGLRKAVPKTILRYGGVAGHFLFAHAWLYVVLPYLTDDLARGGLFLAEPSPFSPCRAFGLGVEGDTAFPWQGSGLSWQLADKKWWLSGLAL